MVKAVIFDLDGTLIDTIEELANASNYALTRLGFPTWDISDYRGFVGNGITRLLLRSLPEDKQDYIDEARALFNEYYTEHVLDTTPAYDGIMELVEELRRRGLPMAVNTNKAQPFAEAIANKVFPGVFVEVIGDEGGYERKPAPDAALHLAEKMGAEPSECIFMGDSTVDLETAENAGMISVLCSWGFAYKEVLQKLDYENLIDHPSELIGIMDKY